MNHSAYPRVIVEDYCCLGLTSLYVVKNIGKTISVYLVDTVELSVSCIFASYDSSPLYLNRQVIYFSIGLGWERENETLIVENLVATWGFWGNAFLHAIFRRIPVCKI